MKTQFLRAIQRKLSDLGLFYEPQDGRLSPALHAALLPGIEALGQPVPDGAAGWSDRRRRVAFLQCYAISEGIDARPVDGFWGPITDNAAISLIETLETGAPRLFQDEGPGLRVNPNDFPVETRDQSELVAAYGPPGLADGSRRPPLRRVPLPWTMKLSWDRSRSRSFLWAHDKVAESLSRVLSRIDQTFSAERKADLGLDLFGGDYVPRLMSGASRASLHSWGIAYDFDPERNPLRANRHQARLGQPDAIPLWEIWEAEGWCSLGRTRNFDFMHVQAAERIY